MPLTPGTRLGPYVIDSPLGAGGMGEVYKARDTRLDRVVAIKVLPSHLAANPDLRERFEREARVVSGLNHPNICTLHDVGHHDGVGFLVMEYLPGETVAERLVRGPLPPDEVLRYAIQIADALDRAHRQGIVHRDLKPGNIMIVGKTGGPGHEVKLLDFGLAKLMAGSPNPVATVLTLSIPTANQPLTAEGTILGTVQYMAPEQLEGSDAGARTDIFAYGVVLYEMATGRRAFEGKTHASVIGAILKDEPPPISTLQPLTPLALEYLVAGCLAKDPDERWQSAHDLSKQLRWIQQARSHADAPLPARRSSRGREYAAWALAMLSTAGVVALAIASRRPDPVEEPIRFTIGEPSGVRFSAAAPVAPFPVVSPDGRRIAFLAGRINAPGSIFVRSIDMVEAQQIPGTENATLPFWSHDSRSLGFFANGALKRVDLAAGGLQPICAVESFEGASWNRENMILFAKTTGGLFRVAARGGNPVAVTTLDASRHDVSHRWPTFLPDGAHFVFLVQPANDVYYGSLDGTPPKRLVHADARAVYAPADSRGSARGHLLYSRSGTLVAHAFDARRIEVVGDPVAIAGEVRAGTTNGRATYTVSDNGVLVYRSGAIVRTEAGWVDRTGQPLETVLPVADIRGIALSPDGQRLAFHRHEEPAGGGIWVKDLLRETVTRVTIGGSHDAAPAWAPDGGRITFSSTRGGFADIYTRSASGTGEDELLAKTGEESAAHLSWARERPLLAFQAGGLPGSSGNQDIWVVTRDGVQKPRVYLNAVFNEAQPEFSPDGEWIAYSSNESGRSEIFVQPYPANGQKYPISTGGGIQPRWRRDGHELFFLVQDGTLMAAPVKVSARGFEAGVARPLFKTQLTGAHLFAYRTYDIAPDGQRFIFSRPPAGEVTAVDPLTVVLNWTAALRR
jgi:eukaryotic-like serine/threonine-protein kinase